MQIRDILLEYERDRAVQALGNSLWLAALRDRVSAWRVPLDQLLQHIVDKFGSPARTESEDQKRYTDDVMGAIEAADPTTNKKYTQWMARQFAMGHVLKLEDVVSTLADAVAKFDKLNRKKKIPAPFNDINRYKTASEFMNKMDEFEDIVDDSEDRNSKAKKAYADEDVTVVVPENEAAACKYGRDTRWCTAAVHGNNYFDQYNRQGPMYILIPKTPKYTGEKYQLHFASGQFMDENDDPVSLSSLLGAEGRFPKLREFFAVAEQDAMSDLIAFAPDNELQPVLTEYHNLLQDIVSEIISDWEASDDYYYTWLREQGHVDEETDEVDWDNAPSYFEYDSDAETAYDNMSAAITLTPTDAREYANRGQLESDDGDMWDMPKMEDVMIMSVYDHVGKRNAGCEPLVDYIKKRTMVRYQRDKGRWTVEIIKPR
jgi:hypothetical protein